MNPKNTSKETGSSKSTSMKREKKSNKIIIKNRKSRNKRPFFTYFECTYQDKQHIN